MGRVTSLELLDRGVPRDGNPIHLQPRRPGTLLKAHLSQVLFFSAVHRSGPLVLGVSGSFLLFGALLRGHLPFIKLLHWSLLL